MVLRQLLPRAGIINVHQGVRRIHYGRPDQQAFWPRVRRKSELHHFYKFIRHTFLFCYFLTVEQTIIYVLLADTVFRQVGSTTIQDLTSYYNTLNTILCIYRLIQIAAVLTHGGNPTVIHSGYLFSLRIPKDILHSLSALMVILVDPRAV